MPFSKGTAHADWQSSASMRICGDCASSSNLLYPVRSPSPPDYEVYNFSVCIMKERPYEFKSLTKNLQKKKGEEGKGKIAIGMAFYLSWKNIYILMNINSAWDSGAESSRCRKFLFCFLFIHFSKHPFYFQWAFKRKQEDSDSGIKRERRILELQSLANPFSVKLCVFLCAVMKRWEEKNCPHIIQH